MVYMWIFKFLCLYFLTELVNTYPLPDNFIKTNKVRKPAVRSTNPDYPFALEPYFRFGKTDRDTALAVDFLTMRHTTTTYQAPFMFYNRENTKPTRYGCDSKPNKSSAINRATQYSAGNVSRLLESLNFKEDGALDTGEIEDLLRMLKKKATEELYDSAPIRPTEDSVHLIKGRWADETSQAAFAERSDIHNFENEIEEIDNSKTFAAVSNVRPLDKLGIEPSQIQKARRAQPEKNSVESEAPTSFARKRQDAETVHNNMKPNNLYINGYHNKVENITNTLSSLSDTVFNILNLYDNMMSSKKTMFSYPIKRDCNKTGELSRKRSLTHYNLKPKHKRDVYEDEVMSQVPPVSDYILEPSTETLLDVVMENAATTDTPLDLVMDNIVDQETTETLSLGTLTKEMAYNDFINGYKYYLNYQRELGKEQFSDSIKYQAHKHHKVDDIGKFILEKLPQIPDMYRGKRKYVYADSMDDQDVFGKPDDSWFKKHFYVFIDSGTPKKFHTSQTVPMKTLQTKSDSNKYDVSEIKYLAEGDVGLKSNFPELPNEAGSMRKSSIKNFFHKIIDVKPTPSSYLFNKEPEIENNYFKSKREASTQADPKNLNKKSDLVTVDLFPQKAINHVKKPRKSLFSIFNFRRLGKKEKKIKPKRDIRQRPSRFLFKKWKNLLRDNTQTTTMIPTMSSYGDIVSNDQTQFITIKQDNYKTTSSDYAKPELPRITYDNVDIFQQPDYQLQNSLSQHIPTLSEAMNSTMNPYFRDYLMKTKQFKWPFKSQETSHDSPSKKYFTSNDTIDDSILEPPNATDSYGKNYPPMDVNKSQDVSKMTPASLEPWEDMDVSKSQDISKMTPAPSEPWGDSADISKSQDASNISPVPSEPLGDSMESNKSQDMSKMATVPTESWGDSDDVRDSEDTSNPIPSESWDETVENKKSLDISKMIPASAIPWGHSGEISKSKNVSQDTPISSEVTGDSMDTNKTETVPLEDTMDISKSEASSKATLAVKVPQEKSKTISKARGKSKLKVFPAASRKKSKHVEKTQKTLIPKLEKVPWRESMDISKTQYTSKATLEPTELWRNRFDMYSENTWHTENNRDKETSKDSSSRHSSKVNDDSIMTYNFDWVNDSYEVTPSFSSTKGKSTQQKQKKQHKKLQQLFTSSIPMKINTFAKFKVNEYENRGQEHELESVTPKLHKFQRLFSNPTKIIKMDKKITLNTFRDVIMNELNNVTKAVVDLINDENEPFKEFRFGNEDNEKQSSEMFKPNKNTFKEHSLRSQILNNTMNKEDKHKLSEYSFNSQILNKTDNRGKGKKNKNLYKFGFTNTTLYPTFPKPSLHSYQPETVNWGALERAKVKSPTGMSDTLKDMFKEIDKIEKVYEETTETEAKLKKMTPVLKKKEDMTKNTLPLTNNKLTLPALKRKPGKVQISNRVYKFDIIYSNLSPENRKAELGMLHGKHADNLLDKPSYGASVTGRPSYSEDRILKRYTNDLGQNLRRQRRFGYAAKFWKKKPKSTSTTVSSTVVDKLSSDAVFTKPQNRPNLNTVVSRSRRNEMGIIRRVKPNKRENDAYFQTSQVDTTSRSSEIDDILPSTSRRGVEDTVIANMLNDIEEEPMTTPDFDSMEEILKSKTLNASSHTQLYKHLLDAMETLQNKDKSIKLKRSLKKKKVSQYFNEKDDSYFQVLKKLKKNKAKYYILKRKRDLRLVLNSISGTNKFKKEANDTNDLSNSEITTPSYIYDLRELLKNKDFVIKKVASPSEFLHEINSVENAHKNKLLLANIEGNSDTGCVLSGLADGLYLVIQKDGKILLKPLIQDTASLTSPMTFSGSSKQGIVLSPNFIVLMKSKLNQIYDVLSNDFNISRNMLLANNDTRKKRNYEKSIVENQDNFKSKPEKRNVFRKSLKNYNVAVVTTTIGTPHTKKPKKLKKNKKNKAVTQLYLSTTTLKTENTSDTIIQDVTTQPSMVSVGHHKQAENDLESAIRKLTFLTANILHSTLTIRDSMFKGFDKDMFDEPADFSKTTVLKLGNKAMNIEIVTTPQTLQSSATPISETDHSYENLKNTVAPVSEITTLAQVDEQRFDKLLQDASPTKKSEPVIIINDGDNTKPPIDPQLDNIKGLKTFSGRLSRLFNKKSVSGTRTLKESQRRKYERLREIKENDISLEKPAEEITKTRIEEPSITGEKIKERKKYRCKIKEYLETVTKKSNENDRNKHKADPKNDQNQKHDKLEKQDMGKKKVPEDNKDKKTELAEQTGKITELKAQKNEGKKKEDKAEVQKSEDQTETATKKLQKVIQKYEKKSKEHCKTTKYPIKEEKKENSEAKPSCEKKVCESGTDNKKKTGSVVEEHKDNNEGVKNSENKIKSDSVMDESKEKNEGAQIKDDNNKIKSDTVIDESKDKNEGTKLKDSKMKIDNVIDNINDKNAGAKDNDNKIKTDTVDEIIDKNEGAKLKDNKIKINIENDNDSKIKTDSIFGESKDIKIKTDVIDENNAKNEDSKKIKEDSKLNIDSIMNDEKVKNEDAKDKENKVKEDTKINVDSIMDEQKVKNEGGNSNDIRTKADGIMDEIKDGKIKADNVMDEYKQKNEGAKIKDGKIKEDSFMEERKENKLKLDNVMDEYKQKNEGAKIKDGKIKEDSFMEERKENKLKIDNVMDEYKQKNEGAKIKDGKIKEDSFMEERKENKLKIDNVMDEYKQKSGGVKIKDGKIKEDNFMEERKENKLKIDNVMDEHKERTESSNLKDSKIKIGNIMNERKDINIKADSTMNEHKAKKIDSNVDDNIIKVDTVMEKEKDEDQNSNNITIDVGSIMDDSKKNNKDENDNDNTVKLDLDSFIDESQEKNVDDNSNANQTKPDNEMDSGNDKNDGDNGYNNKIISDYDTDPSKEIDINDLRPGMKYNKHNEVTNDIEQKSEKPYTKENYYDNQKTYRYNSVDNKYRYNL